MEQERPKRKDVQAQLGRLHAWRFFRGVKLRRLLDFLVSEWQEGRESELTLSYIGESLGDEERTYVEGDARWGYPKTKANLAHVRNRLKTYYETEGYRDPVIIKLNPGSYAPVVAYNSVNADVPDLEPEVARLVLRAKTAIDFRTFTSAHRAIRYYLQIPLTISNPRQTANLLFIPMAVAPIVPSSPLALREHLDTVLDEIRKSGVAPWEAIFAEACAAACYRHEWQKALKLFELAIAASQGEASYLWWYTALLASLGCIQEAITILDRAVQHFSRTNVATRTDLAMLLMMAGRFAEAEEHLSGTLDFIAPENALLSSHFAMLYEAQDRIDEALTALVKVGEESAASVPYGDGYVLRSGLLILAAGRAGATAPATAMLDDLLDIKAKRSAASSVEIALGCIGLGRFDEAVAWLERAAFEESDPMAMWFHLLPPLRHLRGHTSYRQLLESLGLPLPRPA